MSDSKIRCLPAGTAPAAAFVRSAGEARSSLTMLAGVCLVVQLASVTFVGRDLQTPNASTRIAENLVAHGEFAVNAWDRLRGPQEAIPDEPLRAFQLPGEPLYLALGFLVLPDALWRFLHVPVAVALATAIAAVAFALGGRRLAITTGSLALLDPFVAFHGPVWDDTFLAASVEWVIFAGVLWTLSARPRSQERGSLAGWWLPLLMGSCAAVAAGTRLQSQVVLGCLALAIVTVKSLRPARKVGWAVGFGVAMAIGAWGLRNLLVLGVFYAGTSHDGLTLFESTSSQARESILQTGTAEGFSPTHLGEEFNRVAGLDEVETDRKFKKDAWSYIATHPHDVARTAGLKLVVSLTGVDFARPLLTLRNTVTIATNAALILLGSWGLWLMWCRSHDNVLTRAAFLMCALTSLATMAMLMLGPVGLRYRISLAGFLYLGTATMLLRLASFQPWRLAPSEALLD